MKQTIAMLLATVMTVSCLATTAFASQEEPMEIASEVVEEITAEIPMEEEFIEEIQVVFPTEELLAAVQEDTTEDIRAEDGTIPLVSDSITIEEGETYTISTLDELFNFKYLVEDGNTFADATVLLLDDIDMSQDGTKWEAIGNYTGSSLDTSSYDAFSGTFDGQGYALKHMTYLYPKANTCGIGFMAYLSGGTLKNLQITDIGFSISGTTSTYFAFRNLAGMVCYASNATIENCYVEGDWNAPTRYSSSSSACAVSDSLGGLVGRATYSTITNCTNAIEMEMTYTYSGSTSVNAGCPAGGIVGIAKYSDINNCVNQGQILASGNSTSTLSASSATADNGVGGIVGFAYETTIDRCKNEGAIASTRDQTSSIYTQATGGIVGFMSGANTSTLTVSNCWNDGYVAAYETAGLGGIVGRTGTSTTSSISSSTCGYDSPLVIFNCMNSGTIGKYTSPTEGSTEENMNSSSLSHGAEIVGFIGQYHGLYIENTYACGEVAPSTSTAVGAYVGTTLSGAYVYAYVNHSYLLDWNSSDKTSRWMSTTTSSGSATAGASSDSVKQYVGAMEDNAAADAAALNAYAMYETIATPTYSVGVDIEVTENLRDHATWKQDDAINDGFAYLDLSGSGYSADNIAPSTPEETGYTITFLATTVEGDTVTGMPADTTSSDEIYILPDAPTRTNDSDWVYLFVGWGDETGEIWDANAEYPLTGDVTFTALWVLATVDGNGIWEYLDAMSIMDYLADTLAFTDEQVEIADQNSDENIDYLDAMTIMDNLAS